MSTRTTSIGTESSGSWRQWGLGSRHSTHTKILRANIWKYYCMWLRLLRWWKTFFFLQLKALRPREWEIKRKIFWSSGKDWSYCGGRRWRWRWFGFIQPSRQSFCSFFPFCCCCSPSLKGICVQMMMRIWITKQSGLPTAAHNTTHTDTTHSE